jgi:hypothetical protein
MNVQKISEIKGLETRIPGLCCYMFGDLNEQDVESV